MILWYRYFVKKIWMFPKIGSFTPKWMVKIMENPNKYGWFGGKPPIFGNIHLGNCSHKQLHKEPAPNPPWCRSAAASPASGLSTASMPTSKKNPMKKSGPRKSKVSFWHLENSCFLYKKKRTKLLRWAPKKIIECFFLCFEITSTNSNILKIDSFNLPSQKKNCGSSQLNWRSSPMGPWQRL